MLLFLNACPFKLAAMSPYGRDPTSVYQERFDALLPCLVTPNEHVRRSAAAILDRAFANQEILANWQKSEVLNSFQFKEKIWKLT